MHVMLYGALSFAVGTELDTVDHVKISFYQGTKMTVPHIFDLQRILTLERIKREIDFPNSAGKYSIRSTLNTLHLTATSCVNALHSLLRIREVVRILHDPALQVLIDNLSSDITNLQSQMMIDLVQVKSEPKYAGSLTKKLETLCDLAASVMTTCQALEQMVNATIGLKQSKTTVTNVFSTNEVVRYAIVKADFLEVKDDCPINFHEGQHCEILDLADGGVNVANGNYIVFFTSEHLEKHFEIADRRN